MLGPSRVITAAVFSAMLVVSSNVAFPTRAAAQPSETTRRKADGPLREGEALAKAGKHEAALAKFEEAYALAPTGTAAYHVARMEQLVGRHALALQHYREALRDGALSTDHRRDAEKAIDDLKTKVGIIVLDVPAGSVASVDGSDVDTKNPVEVVPGLHVVKIRLGGESRSIDVTAPAGTVMPVKVSFDDAATPPTPSEPRPATPPSAPETRSHWPTAKVVSVGAGAVVGVGLLAASAIMLASANGVEKAPSASACIGPSPSAGCPSFHDARDTYDGQRTASTIFFFSGLAVSALATVLVFVWPNERVTVGRGRSLEVRF